MEKIINHLFDAILHSLSVSKATLLWLNSYILFPDLIKHWKENKINEEFINFKEVEKYSDFSGTRNEEDILITETGYRIMGITLAKSIEDVEMEREKSLK